MPDFFCCRLNNVINNDAIVAVGVLSLYLHKWLKARKERKAAAEAMA